MKRKALAVTLRRRKIQKMLESERLGRQPAELRLKELQADTAKGPRPQASWGGSYASGLKH
jgi:hypothetical protein